MMKALFLFAIVLYSWGCFTKPSAEEIKQKLPKDFDLTSVDFGKIQKEKVGTHSRIDYPNQVKICILGIDSLEKLMRWEGAALYVVQDIKTKNGVDWHYKAFFHAATTGQVVGCLRCNIYDPWQRNAPREDLIKGNIETYEYAIYISECARCDEVLLKKGKYSNL